MKRIVYFILGIVLLASCSTDVDINAPYKKMTVVYGLLDPVADTQWVKINKTFLGDGNNLDYAMIRDSSEYEPGEFVATITEMDGDNPVTTYPLDSITIHNKTINGIFYAPHQTVFYAVTPNLNTDHTYRLDVDFSTKEDVSSETELVRVEDISMVSPIQNSGQNLFLAQKTGVSSFVYKTAQIKFLPAANAPFYEVTLRFNYNEKLYADLAHTQLISETPKHLDFFAGSYTLEDVNSVGQITAEVIGESYYAFIGSNIEPNPYVIRELGYYDNTIPQPATRVFDIIINAGGEELSTFVQVNQPVTGIIQDRPFYTNVTNGIGLFSSRSTKAVMGINLVSQSAQPNEGPLLAFIMSAYTIDLGFCDPDPTSEFACEN